MGPPHPRHNHRPILLPDCYCTVPFANSQLHKHGMHCIFLTSVNLGDKENFVRGTDDNNSFRALCEKLTGSDSGKLILTINYSASSPQIFLKREFKFTDDQMLVSLDQRSLSLHILSYVTVYLQEDQL